jgi:hypothetical protein
MVMTTRRSPRRSAKRRSRMAARRETGREFQMGKEGGV